jgi:hypothetical protein
VLGDRFRSVAADRAEQADRAGLALQAAGPAHRGDQERVVGRGGDTEVEVVVAAVEQLGLPGEVAMPAGFGGPAGARHSDR